MLDTFNATLQSCDAGGVDLMEEAGQSLDFYRLVRCKDGREYVEGELSNLRVRVSPERLRIYGGSLCKFYKGNNYEALLRSEAFMAFEKLSDLLHVPVLSASVSRVDIGSNMMMRHAPSLYFEHLGGMGRKKRLLTGTTLYYGLNSHLCACFYDKNAESRRRRAAIPGRYMGKNVLRYELRFTGSLCRAFGVEAVTCATLCSEGFWRAALKRWVEAYNGICKINGDSPDFSLLSRRDGVIHAGKLALLRLYGGLEAFKCMLREAVETGDLSRERSYYLKRAFTKAGSEGGGLWVSNALVSELDEAVRLEAVSLGLSLPGGSI